MKRKFYKRLKNVVCAALCLTMIFTGAACVKQERVNPNAETVKFWYIMTGDNGVNYNELIDAYNAGQGVKDNVEVIKFAKTDYSAQLTMTLRAPKGPDMPDIVMCSDKFFKANVMQDNFMNLDGYIADTANYTTDENGDPYLDMTDIPAGLTDRFRYNAETDTAGAGQSLYALPNGDNPEIMYYNASLFKDAGIHIISVAEEDIDAYNEANETSYLPRGYCEYLPDSTPETGLATSQSLNGESVIKVFNNQIPMSWNELLTLSKFFSKEYREESKSNYGYLSEWWFQYGWSVGGDCLAYDEDEGQYVFTLGSDLPGYIATEDVTINGESYRAGDVVGYMARKYIAENTSDAELMGSLYKIPSQYEAFREFCALSQVTDDTVDSQGKSGYEVSPSPATLSNSNKVNYFTTGSVAMVNEEFANVNSIAEGVAGKFEWDVAPLYQYREYEGGEMDGDTFKIVGKEYNGSEYTGKLKVVNGTEIKGVYKTAAVNYGMMIPTKASNPDAAWKFLQWMATEGQKYLSGSAVHVPTSMEYASGEEYKSALNGLFENTAAAAFSMSHSDIGDWSYLEDGEWVHNWANILNTDVRNGSMKLDEFFLQVQETADSALSKYTVTLIGK